MSIDHKVDYTYKFRLMPTKEQESKLAQHFGCVRWTYNHFLDRRVSLYLEAKEKQLVKKHVNYNDDARELTKIKEQFTWLNDVNSQSLQHSLKHLEAGFIRFFKKLGGFPRFKSRRDKQSFRVPQHVKVKDSRLYVVKFREGIKVKLHRPIEGEIRHATISRNRAGQYFVCLGVHRNITKYKKTEKVVGIDLGIKALATCSDGTVFPNIKAYRNSEARRRILAKRLTRCKDKTSKGRERARRALAKFDLHIANIRNDHLHKISHQIVSENQTIVMEDLNVKGMMANRKLAKSIWDCSLYELTRQIAYKAKWYGREFIQIDRWFPSSKTCSRCGYVNEGLTLADREWTCPRCEKVLDRDANASQNIKRQGLNKLNRRNYGDSEQPWCKTPFEGQLVVFEAPTL